MHIPPNDGAGSRPVSPPPPLPTGSPSFTFNAGAVVRKPPKALAGPGVAVQVLAGLTIAVSLWRMVLRVQERNLLGRVERGEAFTFEEVNDLDDRLVLSWWVFIGVGLVCLAALILWMHRAYSNLHNSYRGTIHTPGWAIGAWFVPFLNLWRPFKIMQEIWRNSSVPERVRSDHLVTAWWVLWILTRVLNRLGAQEADTVGEALGLNALLIASILVDVVGLALLVLVVRAITTTQDHRSSQIGWDAPTAQTTPHAPMPSAAPGLPNAGFHGASPLPPLQTNPPMPAPTSHTPPPAAPASPAAAPPPPVPPPPVPPPPAPNPG